MRFGGKLSTGWYALASGLEEARRRAGRGRGTAPRSGRMRQVDQDSCVKLEEAPVREELLVVDGDERFYGPGLDQHALFPEPIHAARILQARSVEVERHRIVMVGAKPGPEQGTLRHALVERFPSSPGRVRWYPVRQPDDAARDVVGCVHWRPRGSREDAWARLYTTSTLRKAAGKTGDDLHQGRSRLAPLTRMRHAFASVGYPSHRTFSPPSGRCSRRAIHPEERNP